jgi:flagellar biosynthetic protein FlhB
MAELEHDRNEAATPHKLAEARRRGRVVRSADVVAAAVFTAAAAFLALRGVEAIEGQFRLDRLLLGAAAAARSASGDAIAQLASSALAEALSLLAPLLATLAVVAIVANVAQTGGLFSPQALAPDWSRLNPVAGMQRLLSWRSAFDGLRAIVKLALLAGIAAMVWGDLAPHFPAFAAASPSVFLKRIVADAASAALKVAFGLVLVAAVDFTFTRRAFDRQMRMSRRELREEARHREGDPRIRARLRELRRELLRRSRAVRHTGRADLVITNPTHYAVALAYRHGAMSAPRIVAKGAGAMAATVRALAQRHGIPIVPRPSLARALYAKADVDDALPPEFYRDVAQLMSWVIAMRRARDGAPGRGRDA